MTKKGLDLDFRPAGAKQERNRERERSSKTVKQAVTGTFTVFCFSQVFASSPSDELNYSTHGILPDGSAAVSDSGKHLHSWQLRESTIQYPSGLWGQKLFRCHCFLSYNCSLQGTSATGQLCAHVEDTAAVPQCTFSLHSDI